jgi:hypothetical protein
VVVSALEWLKLICVSVLISLAITATVAIAVIYFVAPPEAAPFVSRLGLSMPAKH